MHFNTHLQEIQMGRLTDLNRMCISSCNAECKYAAGNGTTFCVFVPPGKGARHSVGHIK